MPEDSATASGRAARGAAWRTLPPVVLMAAIAWESNRRLPLAFPGGSDKIVHALAFGLLALFWCWALSRRGWPVVQVAAVAALVSIVWGVLDEMHQFFVPGRSADVFDAGADAAGALLAASGGGLWLRHAAAPRPAPPGAN